MLVYVGVGNMTKGLEKIYLKEMKLFKKEIRNGKIILSYICTNTKHVYVCPMKYISETVSVEKEIK